MSKKTFNYANLLTILRMFSTPVYVWALWKKNPLWALSVIGFAAITDFLDGWVAKKLCCLSKVGEILDAVSDVILFVFGISAGAIFGYVSFVPVFFLISGGIISAIGRVWYIKKLGTPANYKSRSSEFLGGAAFGLLLVYSVDFYTEYYTWLLGFFTWVVAIKDVWEISLLQPGQEVE